MIRSMLFATDLGVYAPFVMQHALALARTFNAELYVIHAVEPMGQFAESLLQSYLDEQTSTRCTARVSTRSWPISSSGCWKTFVTR